jgi:hypothetical protein
LVLEGCSSFDRPQLGNSHNVIFQGTLQLQVYLTLHSPQDQILPALFNDLEKSVQAKMEIMKQEALDNSKVC